LEEARLEDTDDALNGKAQLFVLRFGQFLMVVLQQL
jgi:hypothetical protein